jgi:hypothetical protein
MFTFTGPSHKAMVQDFQVFDGERWFCRVFSEEDAQRICDAMNTQNPMQVNEFVMRLVTRGLGPVEGRVNAECLLADIRADARRLTGVQ